MGRPKGSKNKPRAAAVPTTEPAAESSAPTGGGIGLHEFAKQAEALDPPVEPTLTELEAQYGDQDSVDNSHERDEKEIIADLQAEGAKLAGEPETVTTGDTVADVEPTVDVEQPESQDADESDNIVPVAVLDDPVVEKTTFKPDADLLEIAYGVNFTPEQVGSFASTEELERAVYRRLERTQQTLDKGAAPDNKPFAFAFDEDSDVSPEIIKGLEGHSRHIDQRFSNVEQMMSELINTVQVQRGTQELERFDQLIDALPKTYKKYLGEGPTQQLPEGSSESRYRKEVVRMLTKIRDSNMSFDQAFRSGLGAVFAEKGRDIARADIAEKLKKREAQMIDPPTHRDSSPTDSKERAAQTLNEHLQETY